MSCVVRSSDVEQGVDAVEAHVRAGLDASRLVVMTEDPAVEGGDRDVDAGRAEVGDEDVPGVGPEGELARRAAAGARAQVALVDEPAVDQLADPSRDDGATETRPVTSSEREPDRPSRISSRTMTNESSTSSGSGDRPPRSHARHARPDRAWSRAPPIQARSCRCGQRRDDTRRPGHFRLLTGTNDASSRGRKSGRWLRPWWGGRSPSACPRSPSRAAGRRSVDRGLPGSTPGRDRSDEETLDARVGSSLFDGTSPDALPRLRHQRVPAGLGGGGGHPPRPAGRRRPTSSVRDEWCRLRARVRVARGRRRQQRRHLPGRRVRCAVVGDSDPSTRSRRRLHPTVATRDVRGGAVRAGRAGGGPAPRAGRDVQHGLVVRTTDTWSTG